MKYSTYSEYRKNVLDVPVEIPAEWDSIRLKLLLSEIDERSNGRVTRLLSLTRDRGLIDKSEVEQRSSEANDYGKYKVCLPNDIVMNKMQAWNGIFGLSNVEGIVSPDYTVFRSTKDINLNYYQYMFRTPIYSGIFYKRCRGMGTAFLRLNTADFGDTVVPFPSLDLQNNIANFSNNSGISPIRCAAR